MVMTALTTDGEQAHLVDDDVMDDRTLCGYVAVVLGEALPVKVERWPVTSAPLCQDCLGTYRREYGFGSTSDADRDDDLTADCREVIWW